MPLHVTRGNMEPTDVILPLFASDRRGNVQDFLGTGFFVGDESLFITALHNTEAAKDLLAVVHLSDTRVLYPATLRYADSKSDIALLSVPGYRPEKRLALAEPGKLSSNLPVVCLEYGTTVKKGRETLLSSATRLGNITRMIGHLDLLGRSLEDALELSFPALRGASGAPVLANQGFTVLGMVIGNMSYHLMPAQIETIADKEGKITEETKFMLPLAIAVHVDSLRRAFAEATTG